MQALTFTNILYFCSAHNIVFLCLFVLFKLLTQHPLSSNAAPWRGNGERSRGAAISQKPDQSDWESNAREAAVPGERAGEQPWKGEGGGCGWETGIYLIIQFIAAIE